MDIISIFRHISRVSIQGDVMYFTVNPDDDDRTKVRRASIYLEEVPVPFGYEHAG